MKKKEIYSIQNSELSDLLTFALARSTDELLKQNLQDFIFFGGKLFPIAL